MSVFEPIHFMFLTEPHAIAILPTLETDVDFSSPLFIRSLMSVSLNGVLKTPAPGDYHFVEESGEGPTVGRTIQTNVYVIGITN